MPEVTKEKVNTVWTSIVDALNSCDCVNVKQLVIMVFDMLSTKLQSALSRFSELNTWNKSPEIANHLVTLREKLLLEQ